MLSSPWVIGRAVKLHKHRDNKLGLRCLGPDPYRRGSRAIARAVATLDLVKPRWIRFDRIDVNLARADVSHVMWPFLSSVRNDPLNFFWCAPVGERGVRNSVSAMLIVPHLEGARCMLRDSVNRGAGRLSLQDAVVVQSRSWSSAKHECDHSTKASKTIVLHTLIQYVRAHGTMRGYASLEQASRRLSSVWLPCGVSPASRCSVEGRRI